MLLRVSYKYLRVLTIFCQNIYIYPANLNVSSFDNWHPEIVTGHLRILVSSLRMVTCCCERFTILTDCYELFTEKSICGQSSEDFWHVKKCASPYRSVTVVASCDELFTDTSELLQIPASYYGCLRLTTSWQSLKTCKKTLCMWRGVLVIKWCFLTIRGHSYLNVF